MYTIHTFEDAGREINSPRSLEACLRIGIDPSELAPKTVRDFKTKGLRDEFAQKLYDAFERKRREKIQWVVTEREALLKYKGQATPGATSQSSAAQVVSTMDENDKVSAMLDLERKRMDAVRRRQEKELQKIIQKEQAMVNLQQKLQRSEEEEVKRKREHEKKVREAKILAEKKQTQRLHERAEKEQEEAEAAKALARKEAEFEKKRRGMEEQAKRKLQQEALERDQERAEKMAEHQKKTEALIDAQFILAEKNRQLMLEREEKVRRQMEAKKIRKGEEITEKREKAKKRIAEALEKHHQLHEEKERIFFEQEETATKRAKVVEAERLARIKKESEDRDKRNKLRLQRLQDAWRNRMDHRDEIIARRQEKDKTFDTIQAQREEENTLRKFSNSIRKTDKLENVERVNRMNEFRRLQTLQNIINADLRYEKIQDQRRELLERHREEVKHSLNRKHEIANAMDLMRVTNDFTLLDQLFVDKKGRKKKQKVDDNADGPGGEERLIQTA